VPLPGYKRACSLILQSLEEKRIHRIHRFPVTRELLLESTASEGLTRPYHHWILAQFPPPQMELEGKPAPPEPSRGLQTCSRCRVDIFVDIGSNDRLGRWRGSFISPPTFPMDPLIVQMGTPSRRITPHRWCVGHPTHSSVLQWKWSWCEQKRLSMSKKEHVHDGRVIVQRKGARSEFGVKEERFRGRGSNF